MMIKMSSTSEGIRFLKDTNPDRNKPDLEYCINCEIYTPYAGAAGMLLHKK
jgi:hypothetical protein